MPVSLTAGGRLVITAARSVRGNLSVCALYHNPPLQSNTRPPRARVLPICTKAPGLPPEARRRETPPLLRLEVLQVQPLDDVPERRELLQLLFLHLAGRLYLPRFALLQRLPLLVQAHARPLL